MYMMRGRSARVTDKPNLIALLQNLTDMDLNLAHMHQIADQPMAVINEHEPALEIHIRLGERDDPAGRGMNWRALRGRNINAVMRRARLAVQDALAAEDTANRALGGPDEIFREPGALGVGFASGELFGSLTTRNFYSSLNGMLRQSGPC